jgi:hypothetical protein
VAGLATTVTGKTVRCTIPIIIRGDKYEYRFQFTVTGVTPKAHYVDITG